MMWNYRVVRKKELTHFTYAVHEAYYDNNGKVGSITQKAINPFGETIEELRHSWLMMAEAFGKPILNYDDIPEPGYNRKEDPDALILDEKFGPFNEEEYYKETERKRKEKEKIHNDSFVGVPTLEALVKKLSQDYKELRKR
ncbi:MAG: hypothetical protein J7L71_11820 [Spirochaetaceae bacterium]|nr:hypothetical protein [Spirochaetaceae bacterium]